MRDALALFCLGLSGAAALAYEVCWIREAALLFGSTTRAASTVFAVFFLGLALGSELFGRLAQRSSRPLRTFVAVELALGTVALASPFVFDQVDRLYTLAYQALGDRTGLLSLARAVLVGLVLLPPSLLMGASLPLFSRHYVTREGHIGGQAGRLYALNTLGGVLGCTVAGFALVPTIGVRGAIAVAAALNALAAIGVAAMRLPELSAAPTRSDAPPALDSRDRRWMYLLFFGTGLVALGAEVLWTRFLGLLVRTDVHTVTIVLAVTLLGIVIGSALASWIADRLDRPAFLFGLLQIATGLSLLLVMMLPPGVWGRLGGDGVRFALVLLPPAALSGAALPLALRLVVERPSLAALGVGRMIAWNTMGGVTGSLAMGFVSLPLLGLERSLLLLTAASVALGVLAWLRLDRATSPIRQTLWIAGAALLWLQIPTALGTRVPADLLAERGRLVAFREGMTAHVAAVRGPDGLELEIDGWWQGQARKNHQIMAAHVPALLHPDPRTVLVVGAGTGQTASRFLLYDIDRLDVVDLEPAVFSLVRDHFDARWMNDPRVTLLHEDGRSHLAHSARRYDLISLEPGQLFRPGVAVFYTADFYERARLRLEPGGLLSQFLPLAFLGEEQLRRSVASFVAVFPASVLWYNTAELLLIGQAGPELSLDPSRIGRLTPDSLVRRDLRYSHWGGSEAWLEQPHVFFAGLLMGPRGLASLAGGACVYRDDPPLLDYASRELDPLATREISALQLLRPHLEEVDAVLGSETDPTRVGEIREWNLAEIVASALVRKANELAKRGELERVPELVARALATHPRHAVANRMMGDALALEARFGEAEPHYRSALRVRPLDLASRNGLAHVLLRTGRAAEALIEYRAVRELTPDDPAAHNNVGVAHAELGEWAEAERSFERALELDPGFADASRNLKRTRARLLGGPR